MNIKKLFIVATAAVACTTAFAGHGHRGGFRGGHHRAPIHHHVGRGHHHHHHHHALAAGLGGFAAGALLGSVVRQTYTTSCAPVYTTPVVTTPVVTTPVVPATTVITPAPVIYRAW